MDKLSMLLQMTLNRVDIQLADMQDAIDNLKKDVSDINLDIVTIKETLKEMKDEIE